MRIAALVTAFCGLWLVSPVFAELPANLQVPSLYRPLVESMAQQSPTFQRQLLRIAAEPGLTVELNVVPRIAGARAVTRMVRQGEELDADIQVGRFENLVEMIAHEIEHVIEQLDRIDLAAGAGDSETGIRAVAAGAFETERAARAGVVVAREVGESARRRS